MRPIISFASWPTASTSSVRSLMATTDGSTSTTPRPFAQMSVLAVPRSIPMSLANIAACPSSVVLIVLVLRAASPAAARQMAVSSCRNEGAARRAGGLSDNNAILAYHILLKKQAPAPQKFVLSENIYKIETPKAPSSRRSAHSGRPTTL